MSLNAGNSACTSGLSKRIFDQLTADPAAGFSSPLTTPQADSVKALCWAISKAVVDEVVADAQVVNSGGTPTGDKVR